MSSIVFILGAGASREGGAPLMADFLDVAHRLWRLTGVGERPNAFAKVFAAISQLQKVHSKAFIDINNIESVFAALEMAKTLKTFGNYNIEDIEDTLLCLKQVIASTIQNTLKLPVGSHRQAMAPPPYREFVNALHHLTNNSRPIETVSIITFNYDLAIDFALANYGARIDYGLAESPIESAIPVLKLHGSLNWASCSKCSKIVPWYLGDYLRKYSWPFIDAGQMLTLSTGSHLSEIVHCEVKANSEPVLVPPTWNKTEYHRQLSDVWARAAQELVDAMNIFIIGYSMPPSDEFFKYLYALGTVGEHPIKRFWVFNPDRSGFVEKRFRDLLGPGAEARFQYYPMTFSESINTILKEFPGR